MNIEVIYKHNYGSYLCYPICDVARKLTKLTGTKTFTKYHIGIIESLGYKVEVIPFMPEQHQIA